MKFVMTFISAAALLTVLSGCAGSNMTATEQSALGAGALGAGLGAIVGSQTGHTGAGIAIGAASGLLGGGLIGSQVDKQNQATISQEERIRRQDEELMRQRRELEELRRQQGRDSGYQRYDNTTRDSYDRGSRDPYY